MWPCAPVCCLFPDLRNVFHQVSFVFRTLDLFLDSLHIDQRPTSQPQGHYLPQTTFRRQIHTFYWQAHQCLLQRVSGFQTLHVNTMALSSASHCFARVNTVKCPNLVIVCVNGRANPNISLKLIVSFGDSSTTCSPLAWCLNQRFRQIELLTSK